MKTNLTLLVTLAGAMVGAPLLSAKAELEKQKDTSRVAQITNEYQGNNSTRKTASSVETGQTKTQPEDVKFSAGISEIVKMVRSDTDSAVIQAYIENSPIAYYPSADEIIYLHQLGTPPAIVSNLIRHGGELRARAAQAYKDNQNRNPQPNSPTVVAPAAQAPSTVAAYNTYPDYGYSYPNYSYAAYPYYNYSYWSPFYYAYSYPGYCGYSGYRYGYCAPRYHGYTYNVGYHGGGGGYHGGGGGYHGGGGGYHGGGGHSGGGMGHRGR